MEFVVGGAMRAKFQGEADLRLRRLGHADGARWAPRSAPLFRLHVHDGTMPGRWLVLEPADATLDEPVRVESREAPEFGPDDGAGTRETLRWVGRFLDVGGVSGSILRVAWTAWQAERDRGEIVCDVAFSWEGSANDHYVFWTEPLVLSVDQQAGDEYLVAVGGGMTTRAPEIDLAVRSGAFRREAGFEPEVDADVTTDRFEAMYPGVLSTPLSAYARQGDRSVLLLHGLLEGVPSRIRDCVEDGAFHAVHQRLAVGAPLPRNGQAADAALDGWTRHRIRLRTFLRVGWSLGEECGLVLREWLRTSVEGARRLRGRVSALERTPRDVLPVVLSLGSKDLDGQRGRAVQVVDELRTACPDLVRVPTFVRGQLKFEEQRSAASAPSGFRELPDLFNVHHDVSKRAQAAALSQRGATVFAELDARAPQEWDRRNLFSGAGSMQHDWGGDRSNDTPDRFFRSGARVVNSVDMRRQLTRSGYGTTHLYNTTHTQLRIGTMAYDATADITTFEVLPGSSPTFDEHVHALFVQSQGKELHGMVVVEVGGGGTVGRTMRLLRSESEAAWRARQLRVVGDQRAHLSDAASDPSNVLLLYLVGQMETSRDGAIEQVSFLAGHDRDMDGSVRETAQTRMCPRGDAFAHPATGSDDVCGPYPRLLHDVEREYADPDSPYGALALWRSDPKSLVCFESEHVHSPPASHEPSRRFPHAPACPQVIESYRAFLRSLRAVGEASRTQSGEEFRLFESEGPGDWQFDVVDGHAESERRNDVAVDAGSWGATGLWATIAGALHGGGFVRGGRGVGHIPGGPLLRAWEEHRDGRVEALVADLLHGAKPVTVFAQPSASGANATSSHPSGLESYTPFYDGASGLHVNGAPAQIITSLARLHRTLDGLPWGGARVRSFERVDPSRTAPHAPVPEAGTLSPFDEGPRRPPFLHACYRHPRFVDVVVGLFVNDSATETRSDALRLTPSWYAEPGTPPPRGARFVEWRFTPDDATQRPGPGAPDGPVEWALELPPGGVAAFVVTLLK